MIVKGIEAKDIMIKTNLPVSEFAGIPYVGCTHSCKYCYARVNWTNFSLIWFL